VQQPFGRSSTTLQVNDGSNVRPITVVGESLQPSTFLHTSPVAQDTGAPASFSQHVAPPELAKNVDVQRKLRPQTLVVHTDWSLQSLFDEQTQLASMPVTHVLSPGCVSSGTHEAARHAIVELMRQSKEVAQHESNFFVAIHERATHVCRSHDVTLCGQSESKLQHCVNDGLKLFGFGASHSPSVRQPPLTRHVLESHTDEGSPGKQQRFCGFSHANCTVPTDEFADARFGVHDVDPTSHVNDTSNACQTV